VSLTIKLEVRPLRPGRLNDAVSVSDDNPNALLARDFATTETTVKPRRIRSRPAPPARKPPPPRVTG
jgi:hypothetical protein